MIVHYHIHEVSEYINWVYFFHAWGFQPRYAGIANIHGCDACRAMWLVRFPEEERSKASEAMQLFKEANRMLRLLDEKGYRTHAIFRLAEANSEENDLWLDGKRFPLLRQQNNRPGEPYLCLSDFVRPLSGGIKDQVGIFVTTINRETESLYPDDAYRRMLVQTLADRLAEATAEKLHEQVRKQIWGYAPNEQLSIHQLHNEEFQGIRPAVGYPSLPDLSVNFLLDEWLDMKRIDICLTENGMMQPHASVSGLMLAHPASQYFSVGKINEEQLNDYAKRRGLPIDEMRKFLATNL
ncbi:MAG: 5-methyltetrahydrofolate--homocysteine methyltransferase [Bacteroidaceae bacterium]|nr:5-methyltetrahydrofolate--homocysteine methyltransferase [Bacteroidaceae bacterium]